MNLWNLSLKRLIQTNQSNNLSKSHLNESQRRIKLRALIVKSRRSQENLDKARKLRKVAMDNKMALMSKMEIKISKINLRRNVRRRIQPSRMLRRSK
jgi:hypothetical protein